MQQNASDSNTQDETLWEGELLTSGRGHKKVRARIVRQEGAWLDNISGLGPGMKLQVWDAKDGEWRKTSPYELNACSFAIALATRDANKVDSSGS
jgi:hypothetical protein